MPAEPEDEHGRYRPLQLRDLLTRQALAIERYRAAVARQLGLSDTEMGAVVYLAQQRELTPGELRERLALSSGGTTALIQRLERAGHVARRPNPSDGRSAVISLSEEMRALLVTHAAPLFEALDAVAATLSHDDHATVGAWLDRIVAATEAKAADAGDEDGDGDGAAGAGVSNSWF
ncbi:MarR family transcriptional regulator [Conexibacter stalactiti]|uniref:MarR family transcriptional regulator n=1 Tax=Conexibacter stalactiti TaxID=1940611 RepID=A0ABU4HJ74_9ACTN|nr:MarR family transcriptional regulator [Conexibacter stalactiti]MDW5593368.1 MarR family transcriptional regulator [Conexibacter stalactiti]MEC5034009.1 MarR family transcriptional regulator [Conexibacter stalactiti]